MFVGVHAMLAMNTNNPELAISDDEGKAFMGAAQNVLRHYSVETTQKTLDWVAFFGVAGGMYGTRIIAIANRKNAERRPAHFRPRRSGPAEVVNFPGAPAETTSGPAEYVPSVLPGEPEGDGFSG